MDNVSQQMMFDSLANLTSNLGTSKDKGTHGRFYSRSGLSRDEIDSLYSQSWLGGKVVDVPANSCVREWRQWSGTKQQIAAIEDEEARLELRQAVTTALKFSAKDGGAAILLGAGGDPSLELDINTIPKGGLRFIHVMSRWELSVTEVERDPMSPYFRQPKEYRILGNEGTYQAVHPSRVVPFIGVPRADQWLWQDPWGLSIYERLHDPIRDATSAIQVAASLLSEMKIDVIQIPGFSENLHRPEYRSLVVQRFGLAMALKSLNNALVMDAEETWSQKTLTLQGLPEILERLLLVVSGAVGIPYTLLMGSSPAGMNATGKADLESFYTHVKSLQETVVRPTLKRLDQALIRSATGRTTPRGLFYDWRSLWSPSAVDLADLNQKHAAAIEAYSRTGVFTPEALQVGALNQLSEDNFLSGIAEAVQAFPGAPGNVQLQAQNLAAETRKIEASAGKKDNSEVK